MSRAEQRRRDREYRRGTGAGTWHPAWILVASATLAILAVAVVSQSGAASIHPTPRSPELASDVLPDTRYAAYPRVAQAYQVAAVVPAVLDGLFCYCRCSEHSGHYSLLDCFASDHAASCDICMSEAVAAYEMTMAGADLDAIRDRVDRTYGT